MYSRVVCCVLPLIMVTITTLSTVWYMMKASSSLRSFRICDICFYCASHLAKNVGTLVIPKDQTK